MTEEKTTEAPKVEVMPERRAVTPLDKFRGLIATEYKKQIENYFGDPKDAMRFLSSVTAAIQRNPKLLECDQATLINSFMVIAQLQLMPSAVGGEAYVLPYKNKGRMEAQFQLGYQGLVTLFYRAGARSIRAEIVRENDKFRVFNGAIEHEPDIFSDKRGEAIGAYVIVETQQGGLVSKAMSKKEIEKIAKKFSKSYASDFTPWKEANDPELWMWKKTVLKQASKLIPKNETIYKAIDLDNQDSILPGKKETTKLLDEPKQEELPESTEWRDKLAAQLMKTANGAATPEDVWAANTDALYPDTEEAAQIALGNLLKAQK